MDIKFWLRDKKNLVFLALVLALLTMPFVLILFRLTLLGNILKLKEFEIVKKGICRKFQVPSTFVNLSVYDNMRIAINRDKSVFGSLMMRKRYLDTRKIYDVLHLVGLDKKSKERAPVPRRKTVA